MKTANAKAINRAIESYPEFDTERKARRFASGYIDPVWILCGPGKYRGHFLVADQKHTARLKKTGFKAIEV
jgi:hypothetical protein